jgi:hypothetical protein
LEVLRIAIGAFTAERDWEQFHSPKNLAMALSVEQSKDLPPGKLAEIRQEISDVMVYLAELVDKLGVDPVEAARAKLEINERKYPAGLVRGPALRRRRLRHPAP